MYVMFGCNRCTPKFCIAKSEKARKSIHLLSEEAEDSLLKFMYYEYKPYRSASCTCTPAYSR